ncbi:MAG TPA: SRPBCC family protein [Pseudonocardiaceae bacterium]|nr:SRPBCC family protein [Pseudonocardiaceae bacterium]
MPKSYASGLVPASADDVWGLIRDYNGLPGWHPAIEASDIEGGGSGQEVGCVRRLTLADGGSVAERLLTLDDAGRSYTYEFTNAGPFPVRSYHSTISVTPVTATGHAFVQWWAWFDADTDAEAEAQLATTFADAVFAAGIAALGERFDG